MKVWRPQRKYGAAVVATVGLLCVAGLYLVDVAKVVHGYWDRGSPFTDTGRIIDESLLPDPRYMKQKVVDAHDGPGGAKIGTLGRTVLYPVSDHGDWLEGDVYTWIWESDVTPGLGASTVKAARTDMHQTADGISVGIMQQGARFDKIYVNKKGSWSFARVRLWVREVEVTPDEDAAWDGSFWTSEYPLITVTSREAGDVSGTRTVARLSESGLMIGLLLLMGILSLGTVGAVAFFQRRRPVVRNTIRISGVTSSAINVQSPLASALVAIDKSGNSEVAAAALKLADVIETSGLDDEDKQQLMQLLEVLAEEARRPAPRAAALRTLGTQLATSVASTAIADQAGPLLDVISQLWT